jgi:hypothetical protein
MSSDDRYDRDDHDDPERRGDDRWEDAAARARVQTPAIFMLVFAIISLLMTPLGILNYFTFPAQAEAQRKQIDKDPAIPPAQKQAMKDFWTTFETTFLAVLPFSMVFQVIVGILCVIGSLKMKNMTSRGWAIATAVLNIVSLGHSCCCLTLPIGIWALVVLLNRDVTAEFEAVARERSGALGRSRATDRDPDGGRYE